MKLTLTRINCGKDYTTGHMTAGDQSYWTMEDAVREVDGEPVELWKQQGCTAIPRGLYRVIVDFSNRFQRDMPHILDVPGFSGVRIHAGNGPGDTEGCILVGNGLNFTGNRITDSRSAFASLMTMLDDAYDKHEEIWIDIA